MLSLSTLGFILEHIMGTNKSIYICT